MHSPPLVTFLRKRDYKLIKELGQGACGKTVLLHDADIDEHFVCKKYNPLSEVNRQELFENFVREITLLHRIFHPSVVRVFNYYLYPESHSGYILMEYVNGTDIEDTLAKSSERINELFLQAIEGFQYLEANKILHRDIRPQNILVTTDGFLKIIDLGFGKHIQEPVDFDKSISLNLWCDPPKEFEKSTYDFRTEVYFVGKLFEKIIQDHDVETFSYATLLRHMCQRDPARRIRSFFDAAKEVQSNKFSELEFSESELSAYRSFSTNLGRNLTKIENGAKYRDDILRIQKDLEETYRKLMLEEFMPTNAPLFRIFIDGPYYYKTSGFPVSDLKDFLDLFKSSSPEKKRVILANLHTRLDAITRYSSPKDEDDDIPF